MPPNSNMQSSANQARFQKNFSRPLAVGTTMSLKRSRGGVCCGESVMCFSSLESADPKIKLSRGLRWFPLAFSKSDSFSKYLRGNSGRGLVLALCDFAAKRDEFVNGH